MKLPPFSLSITVIFREKEEALALLSVILLVLPRLSLRFVVVFDFYYCCIYATGTEGGKTNTLILLHNKVRSFPQCHTKSQKA